MIRLVAVDLDGTLLDEKGEVDQPRLARILDQLDQRGIRFVVATGNDYYRTHLLLGDLIERMDLVLANGAKLYHKGALMQGSFWEPTLVQEALDYFAGRELEVHLVVATLEGSFVQEGTTFPLAEKVMTKERAAEFYSRMHFVPDLRAVALPDVLKLGLSVPESEAKALTDQINQDFDHRLSAVTSGYGGIDVLKFGIHKAWGIQQFLDQAGIKPEDVMAFGDSANDLEMLKLAGESYAMANGDPAVQAIAKHQAPANSQAGVYRVLEEFLDM